MATEEEVNTAERLLEATENLIKAQKAGLTEIKDLEDALATARTAHNASIAASEAALAAHKAKIEEYVGEINNLRTAQVNLSETMKDSLTADSESIEGVYNKLKDTFSSLGSTLGSVDAATVLPGEDWTTRSDAEAKAVNDFVRAQLESDGITEKAAEAAARAHAKAVGLAERVHDAAKKNLAIGEENNVSSRDELNLKIKLQEAELALNLLREDGATAESAAIQQSINDDIEKLAKMNKDFAGGQLLVEQALDTVVGLSGGMEKFSQVISGGTEGFKGMGKAVQNFAKGGALAMLLKLADVLISVALEADKITSQFRGATGAGDEFNETIIQGGLANIAAGVSMEDAAQAVGSLKNEYKDFTYLSQQQANEVINTTTLLQKLGFSFSTQSKIMQTATQTMGMSVDESQTLLLDLASTARSLGMDIETLGAAFETNKDFLIRFGEDGQEVFEELAVAAKALGTDLGTLVEVTEKFKTFDGAAQSVGRLNAILGGPFLNSMDMLNASYEDPIEGIRMLREGFEQAGVAVDDLQGAELEAFASALGLSVSKTKELLGSSEEQLEIERMQAEELATMAKETQDIMTRLSNSFKQVLIEAKPIIDVIIGMIDHLGTFANFIGESTSGVRILTEAMFILAGVTAVVTGGLSLATAAGAAAVVLGGASMAAGFSENDEVQKFAKGGVVGNTKARGGAVSIVGEEGPEMIEMPVGTQVTTAPKTEQLTNAITKLIDKLENTGGQATQSIAVYIGQEKIDEIVVAAMDSPAGRSAFGPFTSV